MQLQLLGSGSGHCFSHPGAKRGDCRAHRPETSGDPQDLTPRGDYQPMKINPLKQGALTGNCAGLGTVTQQMVRERAVELAVINGRSPQKTSKSDWERARRELTGDPDVDPNEAILDSLSESERWEPVPGSSGHKVPAVPGEDEDADGRSDQERLVDEGIANAGHDQALMASRGVRKKSR
jgi:hypothetical protein